MQEFNSCLVIFTTQRVKHEFKEAFGLQLHCFPSAPQQKLGMEASSQGTENLWILLHGSSSKKEKETN